MKKKKLLIVLIWILAAQSAVAQVYIQKGSDERTRIYIGTTYTKAEIVEKFGEPTKYRKNHMDELINADTESFEYAGLLLTCANKQLYDFGVREVGYTVGIGYIGVTVQIGDSITNLLNLSEHKAKIERMNDSEYRVYIYLSPDFLWQDSLIVKHNKGGKIISMDWYVPE